MSSLAQTKPNNQSTLLTKFFQQLRSYPAHLKSYVIAFISIAFWIAVWQGLAQFKVNLGFVNFSNVPLKRMSESSKFKGNLPMWLLSSEAD
ncbi:hypothetical protein MWMV16_MWMV16_00133 [Acinetobacter baumannii]|nr:hypothetical protein MWMV16_MWMV16_00133 [Acinetobacter baumannii]